MTEKARPRRAPPPAKFVEGSLLGHILVMTGTGAAGLMAIFAGDLANIFFLSRLGDEGVVAAVGYASSIVFLTISVGIGLAIAAASLVSPAVGAGLMVRARRLSMSAHIVAFAAAAVASLAIWLTISPMLGALGADGRTSALAASYLRIVVPTLPLLALGMTSAAVLRSVGDARRAMYVTLVGALVNVALDPLFIFTFSLGIEGAAIASALARIAVAAIGFYGVVHVHHLTTRPRKRALLRDARALMSVAIPAILTNIATPAGNAYVTAAIAGHGDSAVAGWAIIGRILPVAFGAIFALSGTVGPIIGQNYGAQRHTRLRRTFTLSLMVTAAFTIGAWALLALLAPAIVALFDARGEAADLILLFCRRLAPLFLFMGALFVSNAALNTLGRPHVSTMLNWGRATLGTVPFVYVGGKLGGAAGVLAGQMLGGIAFGLIAVALCYRLIDTIAQRPIAGPVRTEDIAPVAVPATVIVGDPS